MDNNEISTIESTPETNVTKKKKKKKWFVPVIIVVALLFLISAAGIFAVINITKNQIVGNSMGVVVIPAEKRDLSETISLKGNLSGESVTNISSKAASEVTVLNVQVGDIVKKGDVLCELDSKKIEEELEKANVNLTNSEAIENNNSKQNIKNLNDAKEDQAQALKDASAAIEAARNEYNSAKANYDAKGASLSTERNNLAALEEAMNKAKEAYENASEEEKEELKKEYENAVAAYNEKAVEVEKLELEYAELESAVSVAGKALTEAQNAYNEVKKSTDRAIESYQNVIDMEKYQTDDTTLSDAVKELIEQLEDCTVKAPIGGVVTAVNVSVGDINQPGVVMITIEDNDNKKLVVEVDEKDILKLEEGMKAEVTSDVLEDETIDAVLKRVVRVKNQSVASEENTITAGGYMAEISVGKTDLLLGMSAKAEIILKEAKDILCVPYDMILTDESGNSSILIAVDNGNGLYVAKKVSITTGEEYEYYTQVTGGELNEGDLIITDPAIQEGDTFNIVQDFTSLNEEE